MPTIAIRVRTAADGTRSYQVRYRRGGRYTPVESAGTFKTRRDADTRAKKVGEWIAAGLDPAVELARTVAPAATIGAVQDEYIASRRVARNTMDGYRSRSKRIAADLGHMPVDALTFRDVIRWVDELEDTPYEPGTVRLYVSQLRKIIDFHGGPNPARDRRVEMPPVEDKEFDPPDAPEVVALVEALVSDHVLPVLTMELAGSRISETLALQPVDLDGCQLRFRREEVKTTRSRFVEIPALFADALAESLPFNRTRGRIGDAMRRKAGLHPHALRHRRASLWHQQGVVAAELARRLGHRRPSMSLDRYSHVKPLREIGQDELSRYLR